VQGRATSFIEVWIEAFDRDGSVVLEGVIGAEQLGHLRATVSRMASDRRQRGGVRGVLGKVPELRPFAEDGPPARLARAVLGPAARPVKATLFDKTPAANWRVPWHQDLSIAVEERREVPGFGPWSVKDGVVHVQPPIAILEGIVAVRVHLDAAGPETGALRVVPGSHRLGRLGPAETESARTELGEVVCSVAAGGAMFMAPLLLHASSASRSPGHRRVLHIEYSALALPAGLRWASA
jgi:hypothetical protein